jgi:hypothetical protein
MDYRGASDLIGGVFRPDGPHSDLMTVNAALCLGDLVRYLTNATNATGGVTLPSTVATVAGALAAALDELQKTLRQLAQVEVDMGRDPRAGHDRAHPRDLARWPLRPSPAATAEEAEALMVAAAGQLGAVARTLEDAQVYASRLHQRGPHVG